MTFTVSSNQVQDFTELLPSASTNRSLFYRVWSGLPALVDVGRADRVPVLQRVMKSLDMDGQRAGFLMLERWVVSFCVKFWIWQNDPLFCTEKIEPVSRLSH